MQNRPETSQTASLYLHIGFPKTGTTTLQHFLAANETKLKELGYLYPKTGRDFGGPEARTAHQSLAWFFTDPARAPKPAIWKELHWEIEASRCLRVIISGENFGSAMDAASIFRLRGLLAPLSVTIVAYVRQLEALLLSAYKQNVKMGRCHLSFRQFVIERLASGSLERSLEQWSAVFGEPSISRRSYDAAVASAGLVPDFLATIGLPPSAFPPVFLESPRLNTSPPDEAIRLVRWVNRAGRPLPGNFVGWLRRNLLRRPELAKGLYRCISLWQRRGLLLDDDLRSMILEHDLPAGAADQANPNRGAAEAWRSTS